MIALPLYRQNYKSPETCVQHDHETVPRNDLLMYLLLSTCIEIDG